MSLPGKIGQKIPLFSFFSDVVPFTAMWEELSLGTSPTLEKAVNRVDVTSHGWESTDLRPTAYQFCYFGQVDLFWGSTSCFFNLFTPQLPPL